MIINNTEWNIEQVYPNDTILMRSDGVYTLGVTDNETKTIYLNKNLSGRLLDRVLCHELTHVYCFEQNIVLPMETEEVLADFMSLYGRNIVYYADEIMNTFKKMNFEFIEDYY